MDTLPHVNTRGTWIYFVFYRGGFLCFVICKYLSVRARAADDALFSSESILVYLSGVTCK
jgi:hypothetical protein